MSEPIETQADAKVIEAGRDAKGEQFVLLRHDEYTEPLYSVRYVNRDDEERLTTLMAEDEARRKMAALVRGEKA